MNSRMAQLTAPRSRAAMIASTLLKVYHQKCGVVTSVLRCGAADLDAAGHLAAPTTAIANAQPSHGPRQ